MIRLYLKKNQTRKVKRRLKSKVVIRKKISGRKDCPRLVVFRSLKHIYAQLIDDQAQKTLFQSSTLKEEVEGLKGLDKAYKIGEQIAKKAMGKGIQSVVFDRNGYVYHGCVRSVAEGARKTGLKF